MKDHISMRCCIQNSKRGSQPSHCRPNRDRFVSTVSLVKSLPESWVVTHILFFLLVLVLLHIQTIYISKPGRPSAPWGLPVARQADFLQ